MIKICVLASGSTGNVTAIWTDTTGILIDCGRSRRYIEETLSSIGFDISLLKGIVITHGHGDHVGSAMLSLAKAYQAPLYIHQETCEVVATRGDCKRIKKLDGSLVRHHTDRPFSVGDLEIKAFEAYHSGGFAGKPHGFCVTYRPREDARPAAGQLDLPGVFAAVKPGTYPVRPAGPGAECRVGFLTDTGKFDENILKTLAGCRAVVLEANHDPEMVRTSARHWMNKKWVLSDYGHLSNGDHAAAIAGIVQRSKPVSVLSHVFLAHISQDHNTPQKALSQVKAALAARDITGISLIPTYHRRKSIVLSVG